jgi:hypothetical protein
MKQSAKNEYSSPVLTVFGQVEELTRTGDDWCFLGNLGPSCEGKTAAWNHDDRGFFQEYEPGYSG